MKPTQRCRPAFFDTPHAQYAIIRRSAEVVPFGGTEGASEMRNLKFVKNIGYTGT